MAKGYQADLYHEYAKGVRALDALEKEVLSNQIVASGTDRSTGAGKAV